MLLLLAVIFYQGWHLKSLVSQAEPSATVAVGAASVNIEANINLNAVLASNLMGQPSGPITTPVQQVRKTNLKLTLIGVIASEDTRNARALIKNGRNKVGIYSINESIKGVNAKVSAVRPTEVLIDRNGAIEKILLSRVQDASNSLEPINLGQQNAPDQPLLNSQEI